MGLRGALFLTLVTLASAGCEDNPPSSVPLLAPVLLAEWGGRGSGPGEFDRAVDIAVDETGFVYVADAGNHRVQKFSAYGDDLAQLGSAGATPGQFLELIAVEVDSAGTLYTLERDSLRIQVWSPGGEHLAARSGLADAGFNSSTFWQVPSLGVCRGGDFALAAFSNLGFPNPRPTTFVLHYSPDGGVPGRLVLRWGGFCDFSLGPENLPTFQHSGASQVIAYDGTPVRSVSTPVPLGNTYCQRSVLDREGKIYVTTIIYAAWSVPVTAIYSPGGALLAEVELDWDALAVDGNGDLFVLRDDRVRRYRSPLR